METAVRKLGYARVSTAEQNLDMQIEAMKRYGVPEECPMPGLYKVSAHLGRGERGVISTIEAPDPQTAINQSKRAHRGRYSHYHAEEWDNPADALWDGEADSDNEEST